MSYPFIPALTGIVLALFLSARAGAAELSANTDGELNAALAAARPGDHVRLGPGPFGGGFFSNRLAGTRDKPIRISGPSAEHPAVFHPGKAAALQLVGAAYVEIENLHVAHSAGHGLAIDDGGKNDFSCHHVTIRNCRLDDIGKGGTICSIKLAGVADFTVADCAFDSWACCAVDGVGCRAGVVERCTFAGKAAGPAVQFKGGSEDVVIRDNRFTDAAPIAVQIGGSTDLPFFRPGPMGFEARRVTVEHNVFTGHDAAVSFVNVDGSDVRFNTIYQPREWAFRILQETVRDDFPPCRDGRVTDNVIVFNSTWAEGGVNVGPGTAAGTFHFARNAWYCADRPDRSAPTLPSREVEPMVGKDPRFVDAAKGDFRLQPSSLARGKGHTADEAAAEKQKGSRLAPVSPAGPATPLKG